MWQLLLIGLILTFYYIKFKKTKNVYKKFYSLPSPLRLPLIGNSYKFFKDQLFVGIQKIFKEIGAPCVLYLPDPHYCTFDPEEIKIILNHPNALSKNIIYDYFHLAFGNGLLLAPTKMWKRNRRLLSKGFNQRILDDFVKIFYQKSCILKEHLSNIKEDEQVVILFENFAFDSFLESAGGMNLNIQNSKNTNMSKCLTEGQNIIVKRAFSTYLRFDFIFKRTKIGKHFYSLLSEYQNIIAGILKQKSYLIKETTADIDSLNKLPLLDLLIRLKNEEKYTDKEIIDEMATFAGAATDTSGYTMSFVTCLLGMYPDVQQKLYEEVMTVIGPTREIQQSDLPNLKYLEMVILESLRIIPVIPMIGRKADSDIDLGSCVIPSGTNLMISIFNAHRNEKYYPNPTEFNPDRFLPEEIENRPAYTYLPFSAGQRNCIGMKYSMMLMKTGIANIVRSYKISTKHKSVTEFNFESNVVIKTTEPVDCHFTLR